MPNRTTNSPLKTYQIINSIQKLTIYETYDSFYIIGSNGCGNLFKVIKVDRTCDPRTLAYSEDLHEYDQYEIKDLVSMINVENRGKPLTSISNTTNTGIMRVYHAYALVGFIKFLEGYYMVLITKQIPVAILGYHIIYTIEDVNMIYVPNVDKTNTKAQEINIDEQKYLKLFQSIDLRQNFYYSYSYDLTNILQYNLTEVKQYDNTNESGSVKNIAVKPKSCSKFIWNEFLLRPISKKISHQWLVNLVHGYLNQSSVNIFGCTVYVTLIARRSQKYAGTRFLKRGGCSEGYVANEVETEQIVHNGFISSFERGYFTSFVHTRGSIPVFWSQDPKAVPKPPINIDLVDPFASVAARHFKQLFCRLGAPIIILNLVKMREKKAQESILAEEYKLSVDYLRQFLPDDNYLDYICFDMAKLNKTDKGNVMNILYDIAESCVKKTWFFQNFTSNLNDDNVQVVKNSNRKIVYQTGALRVNCVDCLDRTNTAMYVIGKCALAHQLYILGIIPTPKLGTDSVCERLLIGLYEKCGDAIAQQYAGSQLVHRVDTYEKNSIASQSRDMIHTLSRYYSNAFADADKQNAINIFLGIFEPSFYDYHIWELASDYYLHDAYIMQPWRLPKKYIEWIDSKVFDSLPLAFEQKYKTFDRFSHIEQIKSKDDCKINSFDNFYRPFELIAFHELFYFNSLSTNRITNNTPSLGLSGNLKALLTRKKPSSNSSTTSKSNFTVNNVVISQNGSSDDDSTDDSYTYVQDTTLKLINLKEKAKPARVQTNQQPNILSNYKNFELSEKSLNIYKKYSEKTIRIFNSHVNPQSCVFNSAINGNPVPKQTSLSEISTFSIISSPSSSSFHTNLNNVSQYAPPFLLPERKSFGFYECYNNFFGTDAFNADPTKIISSKSLNIYTEHVYVSLNGGHEPAYSNIKIYENYAKQRLLNSSE